MVDAFPLSFCCLKAGHDSQTHEQAYLKLSRTASAEESMRLLDSIGTEGGKPSWASAAGYHPEDGDEFGHLVDEIEDEEL